MMSQSSYPVPPWMFGAVQNAESGGDPNAVSPAGAGGLMQIMPDTARQPGYGVQPLQGWDGVDPRTAPIPEQQRFGNDYLQAMFNHFQGNQANALMAYNGGPGRVDKVMNGQISPNQLPAETQSYPGKVMGGDKQYAQNENIQSDAQPDRSRIETELKLKATARLRLQNQGQPQQPSVAEDVAKSVGSNAAEGALSVPLGFGNLGNSLVAGPQLLGRGVAEGVDKLIGVDPQPRGELWQPFYGASDATHDLGIDYQPKTGWGMAAAIPAQVAGNLLGAKGVQEAVPRMLDPQENNSRGFMANNQGEPLPETPSPQDVKAASSASYQQMRSNGATLNQNGINVVTNNIGKALDDTGLMNEKLHGDTMSVVADMNKDAQSGQMDLEKLDQYRQLLNQVVTKNTSKIDGANPDAYKANVAIHALDDAVDTLGGQHLSAGTPEAMQSLNNARALYSASSKMSDVQRIIDNARYSDVPASAIKNGFKTLAKQVAISPRGYTEEEVKAINYAASTGIMTGALKFMGSRLISALTGMAVGSMGGGPIGGGVGTMVGGAMGFPFRAGATALQAGRGQNVIDLIGSRPAVQDAMGQP